MYQAPPRAANQVPSTDEARSSLASPLLLISSFSTVAGQPLMPSSTQRWYTELGKGCRAALPLAVSILPFIVVFGVLARAYGLSLLDTLGMMFFIFSGVQLIAAQMMVAGVPSLLIFVAAVVLIARHLIYSASLAPYLRKLRLTWRLLLAYLLTDEVYALGLHHYHHEGNPQWRHWYLLGAGLLIWLADLLATLLGFLLGGQVPARWHLGFAAPLTFMGLLVLSCTNRAGVCAALAAGLITLLATALPLNVGLLVSIAVGMGVGQLVEQAGGVRREAQP